MSMNMFCKSIVDYINTCESVTVFQVMVETHQAYPDVVSTFDNCVQRGILVTNDGETYVVVPRNSRLSLKDKLVRKVTAILEALSANLKATIAQRLLPKALGKGVIPVVEVMICDPVVQRYISKKEFEKLPEAMESAREAGMQTFNMAILDRINNGEITEEVGLAASSSPTALKMNLKGIFLNSSK